MYIVGYYVEAAAALHHNPDELVRYLRAAASHLVAVEVVAARESGRTPMDPNKLLGVLQDKLKVFGGQPLVLEYTSPEGGSEIEFPSSEEYVVIKISTTSSFLPTIH